MIGKLLWWDSRDGNGIIVDAQGNEFYVDTSVLDSKARRTLKSGVVVRFETNPTIKGTLCAHNVTIPSAKELAELEAAMIKLMQVLK
jgi:cold shock CspA family protein